MATFWPATNPASFRPCSNPATRCSEPTADVRRRNAITGIAECCARAASGKAAAEAVIPLMKSRRRTRPSSERPRTTPGLKAYQIRGVMSALGQKRIFRAAIAMPALPPKADMCGPRRRAANKRDELAPPHRSPEAEDKPWYQADRLH